MRYSGLEYFFYESSNNRNLFSLIMNSGLFTGLAYLFYHAENYFGSRERNLKLEVKNHQLQLESLKARINPHFLFNTLNNMNALIVRKDENLPTYVSKLSRVLRYSTDAGKEEMVSLKKELEYLEDYLGLIKLQEPASDLIDFYVEGDAENYQILPFILMTLLENAIKHGNLTHNETGYVNINISLDHDIDVEIENSKDKISFNENGSGLNNIIEQLELVYGNEFSLTTKLTEDRYTSKLIISSKKIFRK